MELPEKIRVRRQAVKDFIDTLDTRDKFEEAMKTINVAWGEIRDPSEMADQVTIKARGTITDIDDRAGGTRPITQSPYRFSGATSGVRGPAAHRGEHNQQIMSEWLGKSATDTDGLLENGILIFDENWKHH
jgi:crotonobetainyl-CoA:carnitine CoA-transferase CaiB-like acyl-CoA transferase